MRSFARARKPSERCSHTADGVPGCLALSSHPAQPARVVPYGSTPRGVSFWRKALAFAGPGYMVAVGYMDPGNWATDATIGSLNAWLLVGTFRMWLA